MGILTRLAKLKAYWALITGLVTLVVIPVVRWLTKKETSGKAGSGSAGKTVDAKFTEKKKEV